MNDDSIQPKLSSRQKSCCDSSFRSRRRVSHSPGRIATYRGDTVGFLVFFGISDEGEMNLSDDQLGGGFKDFYFRPYLGK